MMPKIRKAWRLSERRACRVLDIYRRIVHDRPVKVDDAVLRARSKELAGTRIRYGCRRIAVLLRREGWLVNHKRVRRIDGEENLIAELNPDMEPRMAAIRDTEDGTFTPQTGPFYQGAESAVQAV
jgi:putative transposase